MNKQISKIKSIIEKAGLIKGSRKTVINKIDAGVTNQVFSVFEDQAPKFIVRMYGNNLDALIDREYENKLLLYLNQYEIGPKIVFDNEEYRIETFIDGDTDLLPSSYQKQLAKELRRFHEIPLLDHNKNFWVRLNGWMEISNPPHQKEFQLLADYLQNDKNTRSKINKNSYLNEIVLGHGDLCLDNIMIAPEFKINLIDFEYSCNMPRAFDLANHLCEYNGLMVEQDSYPDKEVREYLIKCYIDDVKEYDEEEDLQLVDLYSCISHYQWGCWGVIMNQYNTQFDYELYTKNRFQLFESHYDMFFSKNVL